ncbi:MAG: cyclase family protein [Kosmotogaceae bacterium]|jgi:kynurenine formamidase
MYIELSHRLVESQCIDEVLNLPGFSVEWRSRFGDGRKKSNQTSSVKIFSHHGTHIDVPSHVHSNGLMINDFDASDFILERPVFIECPKGDKEKICSKDLESHAQILEGADSLFVYTGFSEYRGNRKRYIESSPSFSQESLEYLLESFPDIRCLGMDIFSIENIPEGRVLEWPVHKSFLKPHEKRFLIEDMDLKPLSGRNPEMVISIPLLLPNEGCPVTVVARVEDNTVQERGN